VQTAADAAAQKLQKVTAAAEAAGKQLNAARNAASAAVLQVTAAEKDLKLKQVQLATLKAQQMALQNAAHFASVSRSAS
jgi:hypothetical protein